MKTYAIHAKTFFRPAGPWGPGYMVVEKGQIADFTKEEPEGMPIVELGQSLVAPGLVDTHIHGFMNHDVMDLTEEDLQGMAAGLVKAGVTSFAATTLTASFEDLLTACRIAGNHVNQPKSARVQGVHLEGPYFSEAFKGAQNPIYMNDPDIEELEQWMDAAEGLPVKIAISASKKGSAEFTAKAVKLGATVGLGHSDATTDQAVACVDAGATIFIHTFNAMTPLHHREPGMVGVALTTDDSYAELICDGFHVQPRAADVVMRCKGPNRVILVSDSMAAAGMPDGDDYKIGELPVYVRDGMARLKSDDHLAGSILLLCNGVKNVIDWGIAKPADAVRMASENPARSMGIDDVCGKLQPLREADLCVFSPEFDHILTYVGGELAWAIDEESDFGKVPEE